MIHTMSPAAGEEYPGFAKAAKQEAFSHSSQDQLLEFLSDATPSAVIKLKQITYF